MLVFFFALSWCVNKHNYPERWKVKSLQLGRDSETNLACKGTPPSFCISLPLRFSGTFIFDQLHSGALSRTHHQPGHCGSWPVPLRTQGKLHCVCKTVTLSSWLFLSAILKQDLFRRGGRVGTMGLGLNIRWPHGPIHACTETHMCQAPAALLQCAPREALRGKQWIPGCPGRSRCPIKTSHPQAHSSGFSSQYSGYSRPYKSEVRSGQVQRGGQQILKISLYSET